MVRAGRVELAPLAVADHVEVDVQGHLAPLPLERLDEGPRALEARLLRVERGEDERVGGLLARELFDAVTSGAVKIPVTRTYALRDVAQALARLVDHPSPRPIYHLPGTASTLSEFFHMVSEVSGADFDRRPMPRWATG